MISGLNETSNEQSEKDQILTNLMIPKETELEFDDEDSMEVDCKVPDDKLIGQSNQNHETEKISSAS